MKLLRIIPDDTSFGFMAFRRLSFPFSAILSVISVAAFFAIGLNFGIDFQGGIAIQVRAKEGAIHLDDLRATTHALGVGEVSLQEFGDSRTALIRVQRQEGNAACVAHADQVMKKRAGAGWGVKPGPANTGDVEFSAPSALDSVGRRDAVSRVGLTVQERLLPRGSEYRIGRPRVYRFGSRYAMYFTRGNVTGEYFPGLAYSDDGLTWRRRDEELGIALSGEGFDSRTLCYPALIRQGGRLLMFYNGNDMGVDGFGVAEAGAIGIEDGADALA